MKIYTIYRRESGEILPGVLKCSAGQLKANVLADCEVVEGYFDHKRFRVDVETNLPIAFASQIEVRDDRDSDIYRRIEALQRQQRLVELEAQYHLGSSADSQVSDIADQISVEVSKLEQKRAMRGLIG